MASGERLIIGVAASELELDTTTTEELLLDVATISKLPQDMAGLRVTLVLPHITSLKVMVLVPAL